MAARELAVNVWVGDRLFLAGDSPEKEFADQITNPKAWGDEPEAKAEPAKKAAAKTAASDK